MKQKTKKKSKKLKIVLTAYGMIFKRVILKAYSLYPPQKQNDASSTI